MNHSTISKLLLVLIALLAYSHLCHADDGEAVVIWQTNGQFTSYELAQKPVITYVGDSLLLTAGDANVKFPLVNIDKVTFANSTTGITHTAAETAGDIKVTNDEVTLTGFKTGTTVFVYKTNGMLMGRYIVPASGSLQISLAGMSRGIYIIKAGMSTIKIARK